MAWKLLFFGRAAKQKSKRTTDTRYFYANNTPESLNYYKIYKCSKIILSWQEACLTKWTYLFEFLYFFQKEYIIGSEWIYLCNGLQPDAGFKIQVIKSPNRPINWMPTDIFCQLAFNFRMYNKRWIHQKIKIYKYLEKEKTSSGS